MAQRRMAGIGVVGLLLCAAACSESPKVGSVAAGTGGAFASGGAPSSGTGATVGGATGTGGGSGSGSSGGMSGTIGTGGAPAGGSGTPSVAGYSCDVTKVLCRIATPQCPADQVPSVSGTCYGPCVAIDQCACTSPTDCPMPNNYTCIKSAGHSSPFL